MEPSKFLLKMRAANQMVAQLPGAPEDEPAFSDIQMHCQFLFAMPRPWQDKFENTNLTVQNSTLQDILHYMDKQSLKDPFVPNKGGSNNKTNSSTINQTTAPNQQGNRNRRNRGSPTSNPGRGSNTDRGNPRGPTNTPRIQSTDPCPLPGHDNHTWDQCRTNRFAANAPAPTSTSSAGCSRYNLCSNATPSGATHMVQAHEVTSLGPQASSDKPTNGSTGDSNTTIGENYFFSGLDAHMFDVNGPDSFFVHADELESE
jgi:hypothetical protein